MTDPFQKLPAIASRAASYREWCAQRGRTPHTMVVREAWASDSREHAIAEYGPAAVMTYRYYRQGGGYYTDVKMPEELALDRIGLGRLRIGSPADCIQQIWSWPQATGPEYFALRFSHAEGLPHAQVLRAIERFGKAVIPYVRRCAVCLESPPYTALASCLRRPVTEQGIGGAKASPAFGPCVFSPKTTLLSRALLH
jgi:alkanesulfonate monooxygenase SsuD/methylene tetrahydromethanopterin reductase-like flavin-dependent oxidoreductase (luciferase family)